MVNRPLFPRTKLLYFNPQTFGFATKSHVKNKSGKNAQPQVVEEDEVEFFDLERYLESIKDIESNAISGLDEIRPTSITINELQNIPVSMKKCTKVLGDLAQIVFKTSFLVHLHIFDVSHKNKVIRALYLFSSDLAVEAQDSDLIIVRLPKTQSPAALKRLDKRIELVHGKEVQNIMRVKQKAESKIKKVNTGSEWHRRELNRLDKAVKMALDKIKRHRDHVKKKINI